MTPDEFFKKWKEAWDAEIGPRERPLTVVLAEGAVDNEKSRAALAYMQHVVDQHADEMVQTATDALLGEILHGRPRRPPA